MQPSCAIFRFALAALTLIALSGPATARFLSVDPAPVSPIDGSNFNRYWYANNNPYRYVDPDGRQACGKDTGCRLAGGAYGGFSGMMNSARAIDATNRARNVQQEATRVAIKGTAGEVVPGLK